MTTLNWTDWSPEDGCIKAEGERFIWLVRPALADTNWELFKIANDSASIDLLKIGAYGNLGLAQAAAQQAERESAFGNENRPLAFGFAEK